jgi:YVTN family beta-propeller protein
MGRRLALLIATYEHEDPGLRELTAPAADAEALAAVLRDPTIAGFDVTMLINQPHYHVGEAIAELYRDRRRDDLTLLYFTGHGLKDDDGRLYLATTNTRRDSLLFTSLPAEQIDYAVEACASRQKILILDCCYSGAFPVRGVKGDPAVHATERFQGRGRTILTASDSLQYSFEGNPIGDTTQSVFTRHLVQGIREGSADLDGDGDITVDELYSYVHDRVIAEKPQQRPKKQDNVEGRIVLARNINWALPVYLRNSLNSPIATDRLGAMEGLLHLHRIGNDTVRAHVIAELERLADDDSRAVSTTAAAHLLALGKEKIQPEPAPRHVDVNDPHAPAPLDAPPDDAEPPSSDPPSSAGPSDGAATQSGAKPATEQPVEQTATESPAPTAPSAPVNEASDSPQSTTSDEFSGSRGQRAAMSVAGPEQSFGAPSPVLLDSSDQVQSPAENQTSSVETKHEADVPPTLTDLPDQTAPEPNHLVHGRARGDDTSSRERPKNGSKSRRLLVGLTLGILAITATLITVIVNAQSRSGHLPSGQGAATIPASPSRAVSAPRQPAVIDKLQTSSASYGLALDTRGERLYVTDLDNTAISVIDVQTKAVVASIPVSNPASDILIAPDGSRAYVLC